MIFRYTCIGSVRPNCGVQHRSLSSAKACLQRDQRACRNQGGYSDREINSVEIDSTNKILTILSLNEDELDALENT